MEMWSAKLTSSANCSDFLPNPDSSLTDLYWPESPSPRTSQRNRPQPVRGVESRSRTDGCKSLASRPVGNNFRTSGVWQEGTSRRTHCYKGPDGVRQQKLALLLLHPEGRPPASRKRPMCQQDA